MGFFDDVLDAVTDTVTTGIKKVLEIAEPLISAGEHIGKGARICSGGGGYQYAQYPDGRIFIVTGPKGLANIEVKKGTKAFSAIEGEIGEYVAPTPDAPSENPFDTGGTNPFDTDDAADADAYDLLEDKVSQLDRAIDLLRDNVSAGLHDELLDSAIALYDEYPHKLKILTEADGEPDDAVRAYVEKIQSACDQVYAVDIEDERKAWEKNEKDREDILEAMLDVPDYHTWRTRYDAIADKATAFLFADANRAWDDFRPEFQNYWFDVAEGLVPLDEGPAEPKVPPEYEDLNDGVDVEFSDEELEATRYGINLALAQGKTAYQGVPSGYQKAIKAIADAFHGTYGMSFKERLLLLAKAWAKLRPIVTSLVVEDRLEVEDRVWKLKKKWGAEMAEEATPSEDEPAGGGLAAIDLAKKAKTKLATTIKRLQTMEKGATAFASDIETAIRTAAASQKKIPVETLEGTKMFEPSTVNSVSKLSGALSVLGGYIKYCEAQKKLGEEGHDATERLAFEIEAYKTVADIAKSVTEIAAAGVHLYAQLSKNAELAAKAAKFLDCKRLKSLGGVLAAVDIVGNCCVLASSTASEQDKLDAAVGVTEGGLALAELGGAELAGPIGAAVTITYVTAKWIAGEAQEFKHQMVGAVMQVAYKQLAHHAGDLRADGNRLVKLATLMDTETDLAARTGMLDKWNSIADSMGGTVRVVLKICGKTKRPNGLNELRDPGQCTKTLAPLFAPVVKKWGSVKGGEDAVEAAGDVLETISTAFKNHEKFVQIESGTYAEPKPEPEEEEYEEPIDDGYGL